MSTENTNEKDLALETLVRGNVNSFLKMLPKITLLAARQNPLLTDITQKEISQAIHKAMQSAPFNKPRKVAKKLGNLVSATPRATTKNYDKVMVDGRRRAKNYAAAMMVKYLVEKKFGNGKVTPTQINSFFEEKGLRVYPHLVIPTEQVQGKLKDRFYTKEELRIKGAHNIPIAISNQWNIEQYRKIEALAKRAGFKVHAAPAKAVA